MAEPRILVVDDAPDLLNDLERTAKKVSKEVTKAGSAQEAENLILKQDFDLIITDVRMEEEDSGMDVLKAAKEKDWTTQVILVTAYYKPAEEGPDAIRKGAYDYLDRSAPGNYLRRLQDLIPPALERRERKLREAKARGEAE